MMIRLSSEFAYTYIPAPTSSPCCCDAPRVLSATKIGSYFHISAQLQNLYSQRASSKELNHPHILLEYSATYETAIWRKEKVPPR
jgi:hypothetical protein